jgi:Na+-driven multidrug efflux pump
MRPWRRLSSQASDLWVHGLAFGITAVIGAILAHPLLPVFEAQTDTRSEAFGAYLTCIVIIAGIGPSLTLCVFWVLRKFDNTRDIH